jgi:hypothetical protein
MLSSSPTWPDVSVSSYLDPKFAITSGSVDTAPWTAQMCAPNSITGTLQVECFPASSVGPDKPLPPGTRNYPVRTCLVTATKKLILFS